MMNQSKKGWLWFTVLMLGILVFGAFIGLNRRRDPGESLRYSIDEYRYVDPQLIQYNEIEPLIPSIAKISALAVSSAGKIYIAGENAMEIFPEKQIIPFEGTPACMAVDDDGIVYLGMQDHVQVLSVDGSEKASWPARGEKAYLTSIAVDEQYVYVADAGSRRIWRYGKNGGEPFEIGKKDSSKGVRGFFIPSPFFDIDIGTDGSLWVVNPGYHSLENYRSDGTLISSWNKRSMNIEGFSGCCNPSHFSLMPNGTFVTAEKGLPRVKIHDLNGDLLCVVAAPDQFDPDVTGLDVAVRETGLIYVLDASRGQVRIFEKKKQ